MSTVPISSFTCAHHRLISLRLSFLIFNSTCLSPSLKNWVRHAVILSTTCWSESPHWSAILFNLIHTEKVVKFDHWLSMTFLGRLAIASMRTYFQYIIYKYQDNGLL